MAVFAFEFWIVAILVLREPSATRRCWQDAVDLELHVRKLSLQGSGRLDLIAAVACADAVTSGRLDLIAAAVVPLPRVYAVRLMLVGKPCRL